MEIAGPIMQEQILMRFCRTRHVFEQNLDNETYLHALFKVNANV